MRAMFDLFELWAGAIMDIKFFDEVHSISNCQIVQQTINMRG
jgi:hypothetical protein